MSPSALVRNRDYFAVNRPSVKCVSCWAGP